MLTKRTVLILGAGASKPYGFPLGSQLRDDVIRITDNHLHSFVFEKCGVKRGDVSVFAKELSQSGYSSADAFIENRKKWTKIGKVAMAFSLLATESDSKTNLFPPNQPQDHWYETLWSLIKAPTLNDFLAQPLTLVTFNYDRSFEHYFSHVLSNNFNIPLAEAAKSLPIFHVHGHLGEYSASEYGQSISEALIGNAANSIRIVHEANVEHTEFVEARTAIGESDITCFVGFGFHAANMSKLGFPRERRNGQWFLGTHKGIKSMFWDRLCSKYGFSALARKSGGGTISELLYEWLR